MAGEDWVSGFLKRNQNISLRKPEATSLSRVVGFNKTDVDLFFGNLNQVMTANKFLSNRIYNMDETGISTVQKPGKILGPKGQKQVGAMISWERGKNITVVCAFNASGSYIPPMFIYPRKRMSPLLERGGPAGAIYKCSHNGWTNEELFLEWLRHFSQSVKPTNDEPVLLILDNHGSHISLPSYEFCRKNYIHIVSIPPHTSHRLQPLDISFFGPLKNAFNRECDNFLKSHVYHRITPYDIAGIFNQAYMTVATIEKGVSGFSKSGIYPFQPNKFTEDDFIPAEEVPQPIIIDEREGEDETQPDPCNSAARPSNNVFVDDPQPSTSSAADTLQPSHTFINHKVSSPEQTSSVDFKAMLTDLSPIPVMATAGLEKKNNRKQHSVIMTGTPMKTVLVEAKKKKELKEKKKTSKALKVSTKKSVISRNKHAVKQKKMCTKNKTKTCRRQIRFDSSSSEDDIDEKDICDDNEDDDMFNLLDQSTEVCIICGEFGSNELWYRCVLCSKWAHSECSGYDTPENYVCDFCTN